MRLALQRISTARGCARHNLKLHAPSWRPSEIRYSQGSASYVSRRLYSNTKRPSDESNENEDDGKKAAKEVKQSKSANKTKSTLPDSQDSDVNHSKAIAGKVKTEDNADSPKNSESGDTSKKSASAPSRSSTPSRREPLDMESSENANEERDPLKSLPQKRVLALMNTIRPLVPGFHRALTAKDPEVVAALSDVLSDAKSSRLLALFLRKEKNNDQASEAIPKADQDDACNLILNPADAYSVGSLCRIENVYESNPGSTKNNRLTLMLYCLGRINAGNLVQTEPKSEPTNETAAIEDTNSDSDLTKESDGAAKDLVSRMENLSVMVDEPYNLQNTTLQALGAEVISVLEEMATMDHVFRSQLAKFHGLATSKTSLNMLDNLELLADLSTAISNGTPREIQEVLEERNIEKRLRKATTLLKREALQNRLRLEIDKDVDDRAIKRQRDFLLAERMKSLKKVMGHDDPREGLIKKFQDKMAQRHPSEEVKTVFEAEISKFQSLEQASGEFNVSRTYLDWLSSMPWGIYSSDNLDLKNADEILESGHHGLKDVKDRIKEFIAVGRLVGSVDGKILCFWGPPGVGKTSIGKSVARALGRQFFRFSVGGLSDVSEIRGHRRTYIGALPGRLVQALKKTQTQNPVILIDEIDKIGRQSPQGDPASALLETLDPEQNSSFLDHYMDITMDLSRVLFICTANRLDTIPAPLLDRMEIIDISGYVTSEKIAIAESHLIPAAKKSAGLTKVNVNIEQSAIEELLHRYTFENGVRGVNKLIEKIFRKASLNLVKEHEGKSSTTESNPLGSPATTEKSDTAAARAPFILPDDVKVTVTRDTLKDYVGPPQFMTDRIYETSPPGVAMGLGWTENGGSCLYVESVLEQPLSKFSKAGLNRTGKLGSTMIESSSIAYSYARMFMMERYPENKFFDRAQIHLHCPFGAIPKDGPSAGITMISSLLSLALKYKLDATTAMTGEVTLNGKVVRIGGLKEKVVAAKRAGAKKIFFPKDNLCDWTEFPDFIREGITVYPVEWYSDMFEILFEGLDENSANTAWKEQLERIDRAHDVIPPPESTQQSLSV